MSGEAAHHAHSAQLEDLQAQLEDAYHVIEELEAGTGLEEGRRRVHAAEERARTLEEDNMRLQRANEAFKDLEEGQAARLQALERELRTDREQRDEAVRAAALLKANLERVQGQLEK